MGGKVLQDWMGDLSWKQQSVIISSLRGPDTHYSPNLKKISKWIRRVTQNNADIRGDYMKKENLPRFEEIEKEAEFCSVHYFAHLLQGLEIVGYKHPDYKVSGIARRYYEQLADKLLHLTPETKESLEKRLRDINSK